jgi:hypothetical protein
MLNASQYTHLSFYFYGLFIIKKIEDSLDAHLVSIDKKGFAFK